MSLSAPPKKLVEPLLCGFGHAELALRGREDELGIEPAAGRRSGRGQLARRLRGYEAPRQPSRLHRSGGIERDARIDTKQCSGDAFAGADPVGRGVEGVGDRQAQTTPAQSGHVLGAHLCGDGRREHHPVDVLFGADRQHARRFEFLDQTRIHHGGCGSERQRTGHGDHVESVVDFGSTGVVGERDHLGQMITHHIGQTGRHGQGSGQVPHVGRDRQRAALDRRCHQISQRHEVAGGQCGDCEHCSAVDYFAVATEHRLDQRSALLQRERLEIDAVDHAVLPQGVEHGGAASTRADTGEHEQILRSDATCEKLDGRIGQPLGVVDDHDGASTAVRVRERGGQSSVGFDGDESGTGRHHRHHSVGVPSEFHQRPHRLGQQASSADTGRGLDGHAAVPAGGMQNSLQLAVSTDQRNLADRPLFHRHRWIMVYNLRSRSRLIA